jgi:hypothetical protein
LPSGCVCVDTRSDVTNPHLLDECGVPLSMQSGAQLQIIIEGVQGNGAGRGL